MPEGPETKRMVDAISKSLVGKEIISHRFFHKELLHLNSKNQITIIDALSKSKAIILRLDDGHSIISHNQLYGKWTFNLPKTVPKTNRQLRIEFITDKKAVRLWSATDISLHKSDRENLHPYIKKLGPDILDIATTSETIFRRLQNKKYQNRALGSILLDQSFISGLGNYLRSEILFFSELNHNQRSSMLNEKQKEKLSLAIKEVSIRAYKQKGKTIDFISIGSVFGNIANFKRMKHMVFSRDGKPCLLCSNTIIKVIQSSRRIYVCPTCQNYES
tara:strand:+ start:927 stop:1751 length:825 start_codon:yes stop_codon:yes gene_type:complete